MARCRPDLLAAAALVWTVAAVPSPVTAGQVGTRETVAQIAADPEAAPLPAPVLVGGQGFQGRHVALRVVPLETAASVRVTPLETRVNVRVVPV